MSMSLRELIQSFADINIDPNVALQLYKETTAREERERIRIAEREEREERERVAEREERERVAEREERRRVDDLKSSK